MSLSPSRERAAPHTQEGEGSAGCRGGRSGGHAGKMWPERLGLTASLLK